MAKKGRFTRKPVALPKQIIDQLRSERGGIVDFAVERGFIKVLKE